MPNRACNPMLAYASHYKRFYAQQFEPLTARFALTQLEIDILLFLHNNPSCNTARDICTMRGFAKSNVSTALESLRQKGCLTVCPDPENRRLRTLHLCAGAQPMLQALAACQRRALDTLLAGFSPAERDFLAEAFRRMDENVLRATR